MKLGICTCYRYCEAAQMAIRLAEWAEDQSAEATLRSTTPRPPKIGSRWDAHVQQTRETRFTDWAKSCSTVVWTRPPIPEQVTWARKNGIRTIVAYLWTEVTEADYKTLRAAHYVLCPSHRVKQHVYEKVRVRSAVSIPWDTGLPFVRKDPRIKPNYRWILLPLLDREPYQMEATIIEVAGRMLYRYPNTVLSVTFHSSTLAPFVKRRLQCFRRYFGNRVRLLPAVSLRERPFVFQEHDLTLWPVHLTSIGNTGLLSLAMGTPVIAFECPPSSEFLTKMNSIVVPADGHFDSLGIPRLDPDYDRFEQALHQHLDSDDGIAKLQQSVLHGLSQRRTVFEDGLTSVIR